MLAGGRQQAGGGRPARRLRRALTGPRGGPIKRSNFNPLTRWTEAVNKIGQPGLRFDDLRHTGNTLAARAGASTKELMARMGHDSMAAAIIYQRATSEADRAIANVVMPSSRQRWPLVNRANGTGMARHAVWRSNGEGPGEPIMAST